MLPFKLQKIRHMVPRAAGLGVKQRLGGKPSEDRGELITAIRACIKDGA